MRNSGKSSIWACVMAAGGLIAIGASMAHATTWRLEAEKAGEGDVLRRLVGFPLGPAWGVQKVSEASEGALLGGSGYWESHPIPTKIPHAGTYRVWVRHYKTPGKFTGMSIVFRDENGEGVGMQLLDFESMMTKSALTQAPPAAPKDAKAALAWSSYDATFERAMNARLSFGTTIGKKDGTLGIDCVILSDDASFDPRKADLAQVPTDPGVLQTVAPPRGMKAAQPFTVHSSFFAGEPDPHRQIKLGVVNASAVYVDYGWETELGFNHEHGGQGGSAQYGINVLAAPVNGYCTPELFQSTPSPTGRLVTAAGQVVPSIFSRSYKPFRTAYLKQLEQEVLKYKDVDEVESFMLVPEDGGALDYGDASTEAFHKWLPTRYGTIAKLNELWRTNYPSFDAVVLPKPPTASENKAPWFAFREFCGMEMVDFYAQQATTIVATDPHHRTCSSQASGLHIFSTVFSSGGPVDFEDLINVAFADQPEFGWDSYGTLDYFAGNDADFLLSFMGNRKLVNNEFNVHSQDPRAMARSMWVQIGKGLKGITGWTFQEVPDHWMTAMWAMMKVDFTPRDKLAAMADASHEVRRLERLLVPAKPTPFVKPVALYYSRMDLSLSQPTFGIYSSAFDSPYRIYGILRGLGYQVRWISPRQIEAGQLKDVGAVVMVGVKYMPGATATKLAQWVKDGGSLIGDQWPGALDEYDRPQTTLLDVFGIRPEETAKPADKVKAGVEFATAATPVGGGIDPEVLRTLNADELFKRVEEAWEQWDATNPVARAVGNFHLSGFDLKKIQRVSGEVIAMGMGGPGMPAMVMNNPGKGHTLYSALMIGTLYESGPLAYEWDSAQEGPGFYHILDAYLKYSGVQPFAQAGLQERMAWKTRVEAPLKDERGNVLVGITSLNDGTLTSLPLSLQWAGAAPKLVLATIGATRRMEQVPCDLKNGILSVTIPGFDTHATLLALTDSDPLISLETTGVPRKNAGLLEMTPNARLKIKATVWNPSPRKLPAGVVKLYAAPGWFASDAETKISSIAPYSSREVSFEVGAPAICAKRTLKPIVVKYQAEKVTSSPATELVWWTP